MKFVSCLGVFLLACLTWTATDGSPYGYNSRTPFERDLLYKILTLNEELKELKEQVLPPENGTMRLLYGNNEREGLVQIYLEGYWGTVCDDDIDSAEGQVLCRSLGFESNSVGVTNRIYGNGDRIWIDDVDCIGTESSILDCEIGQLGEHDCEHSEDVFLSCN